MLATGQYVGEGKLSRLLRPAPDKDVVVVHDYLDSRVPVLVSMWRRRRAGYRKLGIDVT